MVKKIELLVSTMFIIWVPIVVAGMVIGYKLARG